MVTDAAHYDEEEMVTARIALDMRPHQAGGKSRRETAGKVYERGGVWWASLRAGNVSRLVEAGPDRECAEAVLQLMKEGRR